MTPVLPLTLVPSLPASSFAGLEQLAEALDGVASGFQIDIVDGAFVPLTSWPFTEPDPVAELSKIKQLPDSFAYELDCMIKNPERFLEVFSELPLQKIIFHIGSTDNYDLVLDHMKEQGCQVGLAFTNDIPLSSLEPHVGKIDFVQVMGIAEVGQQGQPFDECTIDTVKQLRQTYPDLSIAIDGSVNAATIPRLREAGANHFAPGSAISKAKDPVAAYKQLKELLA